MAKTIVFDLDDTLYKEIDFLKSGFNHICNFLQIDIFEEMFNLFLTEKNVFEIVGKKYNLKLTKSELVKLYREHFPQISLSSDTLETLEVLKKNGFNLGLVTDGRSITQRNKLKALGIENLFEIIIISEEIGTEKPSFENFLPFLKLGCPCTYIGDNPVKDFYGPNSIGWQTICLLDNGYNIRKQDFNLVKSYLPKYKVKTILEIIPLC